MGAYNIIGVLLCLSLYLNAVRGQCDVSRAEQCVNLMQDQFNNVVRQIEAASESGHLEKLCMNTIKGSNTTQCYIEATVECEGNLAIGPAAAKWEQIMRDIYELCEGACPGFLDRTLNITQCTSMIRFDALYNSSFQEFCRSLNSSLNCAWGIAGECPMFERLFFDLLPQGLGGTANTVCSAGCRNLDDALSSLEKCRKLLVKPEKDPGAVSQKACRSYAEFKNCLRKTKLPASCPLVESVMEILYPQHVYSALETQCDQTTTPNTKEPNDCFYIGRPKFEKCVTMLKVSMRNIVEPSNVDKEQCVLYGNGMKCLKEAGVDTCPPLHDMYVDLISTHHEHLNRLSKICPQKLSPRDQKIINDQKDNHATVQHLSHFILFVCCLLIIIS